MRTALHIFANGLSEKRIERERERVLGPALRGDPCYLALAKMSEPVVTFDFVALKKKLRPTDLRLAPLRRSLHLMGAGDLRCRKQLEIFAEHADHPTVAVRLDLGKPH